jgi:hypothetical protein
MTTLETAAGRIFRFWSAGLEFELRPASTAPDNTVSIMYRREGDTLSQCGVGILKGGAWTDGKGRAFDSDGLYWTVML